MNRLPEEEFNFLVLHYLRRGPYAHLADSFERSLAEDNALPKRTRIDGTQTDLNYLELLHRNGASDTNDLLNRFIWGAHENRTFPSMEGPTVMPEPPRELELPKDEDENRMEVDDSRYALPLRRVAPVHRLLHPLRGPNMMREVTGATMVAAVSAMRVGAKGLPAHIGQAETRFKEFRQMVRRKGHIAEMFFVMYDKTGARLFTGSDDWLIKIWSTHSGLLVNTLRGHKGAITAMCADPTNRFLASASEDNTIRVWSLETYSNVAVMRDAHTKTVIELSWSQSPQLNAIVSAAQDGFLRLWEPLPNNSPPDIETLLGKERSIRFKETAFDCNGTSQSPCQSGPLSPAGTRAIVSCKDGSVRIFSLTEPRQLQRIVAHGSIVPVSAWSHDASRFLTSSDDGTSKIFEYINSDKGWGQKLTLSILEYQLPGPKPKMHGAKWSLHDDLIILAFQRTPQLQFQNLKVFDANSGKFLGCLEGHTHDVHAMALHPTDPRILATAGYDQRIIIWNIYTREPITILEVPHFEDEECPLTEVAWNPNGTQLVVSDIVGTFTLFGIGPSDSFKGPVEQFFSTDYNETAMDEDGWIVDMQSQLPPHLTERTPLCFRTGIMHDTPPVLPPLRDPRTQLPGKELRAATARRKEEATAEDEKFHVMEAADPRARGPAPIVRGAIVARAPSPQRALRSNSVVDHLGAAPARHTTATPSAPHSSNRGPTRLRRNASATAAPTQSTRRASRPSAVDDDHIHLSSSDEATARAIYQATLELEDQMEEDFSAASSDDESISSDGAGGRPRDAFNEDLYWSGDENTSQFMSPAERRMRREASRVSTSLVAGRTRGARRGPGETQSRPNVVQENDYSDDEEYRGPKTSAPPSGIKRGRGRPRKDGSAAMPNAARAHLSRTKREYGMEVDEEDVDIMSNSSDLPALLDSEDEEWKSTLNTSTTNRRKSARHEPPKYPSWVHQRRPSANYCPQLGDEIVFCRQGYKVYADAFPQWKDEIPANLHDMTFCVITNIEYHAEPFIHAVITLQTISPQPTIPEIDTDPTHEAPPIVYAPIHPDTSHTAATASTADLNTNGSATPSKKSLKLKITRKPTTPSPLPFTSIASQARAANAQFTASSSPSAQIPVPTIVPSLPQRISFPPSSTHEPSVTFTIHFHANTEDTPDFLVLATRFNQGMSAPWFPGKEVSAWISNAADPSTGDSYPGRVLDVIPGSPWEAVTVVWEDETSPPTQMNTWELDTVDADGKIAPIYVESINPQAAMEIANDIERLMKDQSKITSVFTEPVSLEQWPSYLNANPWPVYLNLILQRLRSGWYRTVSSLVYDTKAIYKNSERFNGSAPITNDASLLSNTILEMINARSPVVTLVQRTSYEDDQEDEKERPSKKKKKGAASSSTHKRDEDISHSYSDEPHTDHRDSFAEEEADDDDFGEVRRPAHRPRSDSSYPHETPRHAPRNASPAANKKKKKRKRKKGMFGETYSSETTDPEDLLPYNPTTHKKPANIVDPGGYMPLHEENHAQRQADAAAERALHSRHAPAAVPTAHILRVASSSAAPSTRASSSREPVHQEPPITSSPAGRPVRSTRTTRSFREDAESHNFDMADEYDVEPERPKRRR